MSANRNPSAAWLFPGQGVDVAALGPAVASALPDLFAAARDAIGDDPFARSSEGTRFAQPAIFLASLEALERLDGDPPGLYAGHSLGEFSALVAAEALQPADGLRAVVERGRLMEEAAREGAPGGMMAVGADRETAAAVASEFGLALANENSPLQFVVSGPVEKLEVAEPVAKERGVRVKRLAVAGAFHSPSMQPAAAPFRELLDQLDFSTPAATVISSVTAEPLPADPRDVLAEGITSPVRWVKVLRRLRSEGVEDYVDVGPGKVLARLVRKNLEGISVATNEPAVAQGV